MSRLLLMESIHKSHDKAEICKKLFLGKSILLILKNKKDSTKEVPELQIPSVETPIDVYLTCSENKRLTAESTFEIDLLNDR